MALWTKLRILLLAVTLASIVLVLVKIALTKTTNQPKSLESGREAHVVELFEEYICVVSHFKGNYNVVSSNNKKLKQIDIREQFA